VWLHNFVRVVSPPLVHARQLRGVTVDITERKAVEQQLERQAFADPVTALPNRALFMDRLAHAMRRRDRRPGGVVMLLMDLDRFKLINDAFGHAGGDELLRAVGERLQSCLRDEDTLARFGGDEFALLFGELPGAAPATELAERLLQRFQAPFLIQGREVRVSASMGIATSQGGVILPEDLLRNADVALYRAKAAGRARYVVFDQPIEADVARRSQLESELYLAQERGQFRLHYQPEVDLETASIVGVEVLLRWEHPERGLLLPGEFLALAEETGLILPIGRWVREEASRQMRAWNRARPGRTPLVLSVNLCAKEFQDPGLHAELNRLLSDSEADLAPLRLELTESILLDDLTQAAKSIGHLKQMGVQVALDDFGTGFSSLGYLRHLPVDVLKIDRTFVEELGTDETSGAIVKAIIELGHALQMEITVEGIETRVQWEGVQQTSCARGQGYYFFSPVEGAQMAPLLA
jgi:diguanylate cyclase (GGDEF)-like protein